MVWNEDLAKLKQQLKDQGPEVPRPAPPKPPAPPPGTQSMEEEDGLFLSAMGQRPQAAASGAASGGRPGPALPAGEPSSADFQAAMAQLGGVKGLQPERPAQATPGSPRESQLDGPPQVSPGLLVRPMHLPPDAEPEAETVDIPPPPPQGIRPRPGPLLIQLAAGMAIEVDATLDLRGHSVSDAKERLRERVADGLAMGWRTLLVNLGPGEALKQGLLAFLTSSAAASIQRYAQAPVPMGGTQAWILYLGVPGA